MQEKNYKPLKIISQEEAIKNANKKIKRSMYERYPGLLSRWPKVNRAVGGSFRFGEITYLAGASGSGKSFILNMLREDFAGELNKDYPYPFKILAFSFEMASEDEIIRTYSSKLKTSYSNLVSAYKKITKEFYNIIEETSKELNNDIIHYVETTGNKGQILQTVEEFATLYPEHKLIITLDHSLLMEYLDEKNEIELVTNVARMALYLKKRYRAMVIILGQLNDKIEQPERIKNPMLHYPTKTDIHGSKQIFHIADTIIIIHRPELLNIQSYGRHSFPAKDLIAFHIIKSRLMGTVGMIRFKQDFAHGTLIEWEKVDREKDQTKLDLT